jgi:hypothetical protein
MTDKQVPHANDTGMTMSYKQWEFRQWVALLIYLLDAASQPWQQNVPSIGPKRILCRQFFPFSNDSWLYGLTY